MDCPLQSLVCAGSNLGIFEGKRTEDYSIPSTIAVRGEGGAPDIPLEKLTRKK